MDRDVDSVTAMADTLRGFAAFDVQAGILTRRPRVLVVEDKADLRAALCDAMNEHGFDVDEAADGRDALAQLDCERQEAVLLDLMLPRLSGAELLRSLQQDALSPPPIVVYSAHIDSYALKHHEGQHRVEQGRER